MINTCCLLCLCFMSCCLTVHATGCTEESGQVCGGDFEAATANVTDLEKICAAANTMFECLADKGCCDEPTMAEHIGFSVEQFKDTCTGSSAVSNPCGEKPGECGCMANDEEHEGYCEVGGKTVDNCAPYKTGGKCHWGPKEDPQCYQVPTCGDVKAMYKFDKCCGNPAGIFTGFGRRLVEDGKGSGRRRLVEDGKGSGRRLGEDDIFAEVEAKLARTLRFEGASSAKRFAQQIGDLVSPDTSTLL